jgi:hypothetical protein
MDAMLELTDIARPWMSVKHAARFLGENRLLHLKLPGEAREEVVGQEWDVIATLPKPWNVDGDYVQPMV